VSTRTRARLTTLAVGYARRSTDRQEQSIGDQRDTVETYAMQHGYEIIDWYVDDAISGAGVEERQAFLHMVEDARVPGCAFKAVLVYDVKRFGRLDNDETGYYRHLLRMAGVDVVYVAEGFNGDDTDDLLRPVKQWQARQELKDLSRVTIRGLLSRGRGGWWLGGVPPYGYDLAYYDEHGDFLMIVRYLTQTVKEVLDGEGHVQRRLGKGDHLMISKSDHARPVPSSPDRVEIVQRIFLWYVRDGMGFRSIADQLNAEGIPSPRGGKWSMTTVRSMLRNPVYTGDMVWNRRTMAKFHRVAGGRAVARRSAGCSAVDDNERDDWMVTRDAHPNLIDRRTFELAQARRKERQKHYKHNYRRGHGARSNYLLTGLIVCAHCGHNWQGYTVRKGRRRKDGSQIKTEYYICSGYITKGTSVCRRSVVPRKEIEGGVFEAIRGHVRHYVRTPAGKVRLRRALARRLGAETVDPEQAERLRRERDDTLGKINGILDNITATNREFADRRIAELKKQLRRVEARLDESRLKLEKQPDLEALTDELLAYMRTLDQMVAEGTVAQKRRFIRAFVKRIDVDPDSQERRIQLMQLPLRALASAPLYLSQE